MIEHKVFEFHYSASSDSAILLKAILSLRLSVTLMINA